MRVSLKTVPALPTGCMYWERALDPFHTLAQNNGQAAQIKSLSLHLSDRRVRSNGWMAIDDSDTPVLFVADSTVLPDDFLGEFELRACVYSKTRAYPKHNTARKCYEQFFIQADTVACGIY